MSFPLMRSNLQDRWQRVKINTTFSSWILQKVLQGAVFGPTLLNIYINDTSFAIKGIDIRNFADDLTQYICDSNVKSVLEML